ncbi:MAG: DUF2974 domain-containing protein [Treponema sp.]|jgi:hypothetical protein|nr:DUF2974 domain-containing protein [Treponema sp.]
MANIFDYLAWRGDLDFSQHPFNPADNIVLCQLSYLPMDNIVSGPDTKEKMDLSQAMKMIDEKLKAAVHIKSLAMYRDDPRLPDALISSKRFANCRIFGYVNHIDTNREIQFSAVCIDTGDGSCFVSFRGTDFSLIGWKEDTNMSFKEVIPAQKEAVNYLEKMAYTIKGPIRLGGHSKGGNLAVYAASNCDKKIQKRITEIYSNDAPGFHKKIIESEGFAQIRKRVQSFIPQGSVVGKFLEQGCDYRVVKSSQIGLLQHELYSWEVTHNDMVYVDDVSVGSRFVDKTLREWIGNLDNEKREQFFDALFTIIFATEAKSLVELERSRLKAAGRMIKALGKFDISTRRLIRNTIMELFRSATRNIDTFIKPEKKE